jgi:3',5'-cyclic AMP phosphodiesterase CpdA
MAVARATFPFELVLMLGDNFYGRHDFAGKFERPYAPLLGAGVPFYAALGNHDNDSIRFYAGLNMGGERYYTYAKRNVRFFVLDSNSLDPQQLAWIERAMAESSEDWKICYFHHPLYSSAGRHGSNVELRVVLEPILVKYGIDVVFAGHDHVYERTRPQRGVTHFVAGSGGKLRKGDVRPTGFTAAYFDQDQTFVLVEIDGDEMFFQARSRRGVAVDAGVIRRQP